MKEKFRFQSGDVVVCRTRCQAYDGRLQIGAEYNVWAADGMLWVGSRGDIAIQRILDGENWPNLHDFEIIRRGGREFLDPKFHPEEDRIPALKQDQSLGELWQAHVADGAKWNIKLPKETEDSGPCPPLRIPTSIQTYIDCDGGRGVIALASDGSLWELDYTAPGEWSELPGLPQPGDSGQDGEGALVGELQERVEELEAQLARAAAGLEPFALKAKKYDTPITSNGGPYLDYQLTTVKIGDLRRAREALANCKGEARDE